MWGWAEIKNRVEAPAPQPATAPPPPPPPRDPPPLPRATVDTSFADKVSNALGALFGGKPKKLPQPVPCGGCGGIIWT